MKKLIGILLISSLLINSLFAGDKSKANKVQIMPIKTPYNTIQTNAEGKSTQTVVSDSGIEITLDAELKDDDLQYNLKLTNLRNKNFKVQQDCIKTYYGNFEKDDWTENDYTVYKLPEQTTTPQTSTNKSDEETALQTCLIVGASCLCALGLLQICNATESSGKKTTVKNSKTRRVEPRHTPPSSSRHHSSRGNTNFIWLFIDDDAVSSSSDRNTSRNTDDYNKRDAVVTPVVPEDEEITNPDIYKGSFLVPAGKGPDYKLRFIVSDNEYIDFYFSRSDRDDYVNPFKDRSYARHSLLVSSNLDFSKWGGYYIYSGAPVGFYLGGSVAASFSGDTCGTTNGNDFNDIFVNYTAGYPNPYDPYTDYRYGLTNISDTIFNTLTVDFGFTIKAIPHTWIMLGCGMDMNKVYKKGDICWKTYYEPDSAYNDSSRKMTTGWIEQDDVEFEFYPEIGINLIFDHIDIGAMCQYSIVRKEASFTIMAGIAF